MSSAKKRRELNRAIEEHERAKTAAQYEQGKVQMENLVETVLGQHVTELEAKLAAWVEQNLELQALVQEKQAQIDALMLEYCPDEMTAAQVEEWKRNQKPATDERIGSPE